MANSRTGIKQKISYRRQGKFPIVRAGAGCNNAGMTYPRSQLVSEHQAGFYHVVSRCVRRAFLCGQDPVTGQSFEHRRQWIEARILELADCFAVSVYAYAIMHNHFHIVLRVDPAATANWTNEEIAQRWLTAFPGRLKDNDSPEMAERFALALLGNAERLAEVRQRLGSLSWFMKALNEPIARRANREDNCTGKFWEGRFKCQALLEEHAVLSCMAYVDLNPARAAICDTLAESDHTSIQRRLRERDTGKANGQTRRSLPERPLQPVAGLDADTLLGMTESSYIDLVQWTGEQARPDKRGRLRALNDEKTGAPADVWQISHPKAWVSQVQGTESAYFRAIGSAEALMAKAESLGQVWMKGVAGEAARKILRERPS